MTSFLDIGGSSLAAVMVTTKLRNSGVLVPSVTDLLTASTLVEFAASLERAEQEEEEEEAAVRPILTLTDLSHGWIAHIPVRPRTLTV